MRGGKRKGAGRKADYAGLKTKAMKLPIKFEKEIKEFARMLANNEDLSGYEKERFKDAYLKIGGGRPYVFIHKIRNHLKWPREKFDKVLKELCKNNDVLVHGGDPSKLSKDEVEDSYKDKLGYLRITISWSFQ